VQTYRNLHVAWTEESCTRVLTRDGEDGGEHRVLDERPRKYDRCIHARGSLSIVTVDGERGAVT